MCLSQEDVLVHYVGWPDKLARQVSRYFSAQQRTTRTTTHQNRSVFLRFLRRSFFAIFCFVVSLTMHTAHFRDMPNMTSEADAKATQRFVELGLSGMLTVVLLCLLRVWCFFCGCLQNAFFFVMRTMKAAESGVLPLQWLVVSCLLFVFCCCCCLFLLSVVLLWQKVPDSPQHNAQIEVRFMHTGQCKTFRVSDDRIVQPGKGAPNESKFAHSHTQSPSRPQTAPSSRSAALRSPGTFACFLLVLGLSSCCSWQRQIVTVTDNQHAHYRHFSF